MKKLKLLLSGLFLMTVCPAFAVDADGLGLQPYIAVRAGATYLNLNYKYDGEKKTVDDTVFQGRAAVGMSFYRTGRAEIEVSAFTKGKHKTDFTVGEIDFGLEMQTLHLNAYMDIGKYSIVQPFIGLGAGVARTVLKRDASFLGVGTSLDDEKDYKISAMGTIGLAFALEHFVLDIAGRYNYVDVAEGMHNFGADVGIRFVF